MPGVAYGKKDTARVVEHVVVPKADHPIAARHEPSGTGGIPCLAPSVLAAVHLHDKAGFGTKEIDDIGTDRLLTAEAQAVELFPAQMPP